MFTTSNMGLTVPQINDPSPGYVTNLSGALTSVDAHDHTTGKGVQVPSLGINVNANLPFNTNSATGLRSAQFSNLGAALSLSADFTSLYVTGGNLFFLNGTGTSVQLTGLGSTPSYGFSSDYGVFGATAVYTHATKQYSFFDETSLPAVINCGGLAASGPVSTTSTLAVTGAITTSAAITAGGTVTAPSVISGSYAFPNATTITYFTQPWCSTAVAGTISNSGGWLKMPASSSVMVPLNLPATGTMQGFVVYYQTTAAGTGSANVYTLYYTATGTGVAPVVVAGTVNSPVLATNGAYSTTVTLTTPQVFTNLSSLALLVMNGMATDIYLTGVSQTVTAITSAVAK